MKPVEFTRVRWIEWDIQPPYEHRKTADLTNRQLRKYKQLASNSLTEAAEFASTCQQENLAVYASRKRILIQA